MTNVHKLDEFTDAYIEAALWSSTDESTESGGCPMDDNYGPEDIAQETLEKMVADCKAFQGANWDDIKSDPKQAGHDFWLTRNGHGAGFWDGDWPDAVGKRLTQDSKAYGSFNLYVGDDNLIHGS
jgi:hypothetical protein